MLIILLLWMYDRWEEKNEKYLRVVFFLSFFCWASFYPHLLASSPSFSIEFTFRYIKGWWSNRRTPVITVQHHEIIIEICYTTNSLALSNNLTPLVVRSSIERKKEELMKWLLIPLCIRSFRKCSNGRLFQP